MGRGIARKTLEKQAALSAKAAQALAHKLKEENWQAFLKRIDVWRKNNRKRQAKPTATEPTDLL